MKIFLFLFAVTFTFATEVPNALPFLPPPPAKGTAQYTADSAQYIWGKFQRSTPRGDSAIEQVNGKTKNNLKFFGDVIGLPLTKKDFPATASAVKYVADATKESIRNIKKTYARHRPYQDFDEATPIPEEESITDFTSYPSFHAARAWSIALLFTMLVPERQNEILKLGYEMGQSRVILGFHYQSDVDAARLVASAVFASLCSNSEFLQIVEKAKVELKKKKK